MKTTVGLWIDHRKAIIVFLSGEEEEVKQIKSDVEKPGNSSVRADDLLQNQFTEHLNNYYDKVIAALRNAESLLSEEAILIMGPGEAKGELKKRLEINHLNGREVEVETTDKMTDPQIVAKVREYFKNRLR